MDADPAARAGGACRRGCWSCSLLRDEPRSTTQTGRWIMGADRTPRTDVLTNPLPGVVLGDPFVLRHRGRFYLYGTNDGPPLADGRMIPVHRSDDLLHWEPLGGALEPSEPEADHWAPEVMYWNGRFFMVVRFGAGEGRV